jgi:hypothetical protein
MKDGLRFVDSDMHVMEPPDIFDRYLDPKFRDRVTVKLGADGRPARGPAGTILIDGQATSDADFQQYRKRQRSGATKVISPLAGSRLQETNRLDFAIERDYDPEAQVTGMAIEPLWKDAEHDDGLDPEKLIELECRGMLPMLAVEALVKRLDPEGGATWQTTANGGIEIGQARRQAGP